MRRQALILLYPEYKWTIWPYKSISTNITININITLNINISTSTNITITVYIDPSKMTRNVLRCVSFYSCLIHLKHQTILYAFLPFSFTSLSTSSTVLNSFENSSGTFTSGAVTYACDTVRYSSTLELS